MCPQTGEWVIDLSGVYFIKALIPFMGFPCGSPGKESACNAGDLGLIPGSGRSAGEGSLPSPVFSPGEFHGLCSPWGHKESDTIEWLPLSLSPFMRVPCPGQITSQRSHFLKQSHWRLVIQHRLGGTQSVANIHSHRNLKLVLNLILFPPFPPPALPLTSHLWKGLYHFSTEWLSLDSATSLMSPGLLSLRPVYLLVKWGESRSVVSNFLWPHRL